MNSPESTRRAYLVEPYRRNFTAEVRAIVDAGGRPAALLSETWFYPEGGGQPADRGTLGPAQVLDVQEDAGRILHILDRPVGGGEQAAAIDWTRRFDHMQQHTGQHLLSRCFQTIAGAETVSFHLGSEEVTIDLDPPSLAAERIADAEDLANRTVIGNLPVEAIEVDAKEAAAMGAKCPAGAGDRLRVVLIGNFDRTACAGTHVAATGEIGPVKVRRVERKRGQLRVTFLCGQRSLADYAWRHEALRRLAAELSTGERQVPELVTRIAGERRALERRLYELETELGRERAAGELERAERIGAAKLVRAEVESMNGARSLATSLAQHPGVIALVGIREDRPRLLFAAAEDLELDLAAVMREVAPMIGGKGGGRPRWAEAGGEDSAGLSRALAEAAARVRALLA